jgi:phosphoribosylaminoimidazolecarboxamide formyltransferase/IMP cyclohydrolase
MMGGRLKTLHPKVFGGILADRDNPEHLAAVQAHGIELIDMVVVNLYDFAGNPSIEQIDVGGPSMIRAAAKNHIHVIVVVDPKDYDRVTQMIADGSMTRMHRQGLATLAFFKTMMHDSQIYDHFCECTEIGDLVELGKH